MIPVQQRIGKYELDEYLGGGMSHVYRAHDTLIGGTVAIKVLTEEACLNLEAKARFLAEARIARNVVHDNIITIYDFGEDEQHRPFMVMEFLNGRDLRHAINGGHTGDLNSKLKIVLQLARALHHIHGLRIVHRDIKPANVHITPGGLVKLMDFGIAKAEGVAMTRAGCVVGTPYYMAPEQVMGNDITAQVDVYAFGVMLFELLTGVRPVQGENYQSIFYRILNEPLNLEPLHASGTPAPVYDLVARCTEKIPAHRPAGFGPVIAALEGMISQPLSEGRTLSSEIAHGSPSPVKTRHGLTSLVRQARDAGASRPLWAILALAGALLSGVTGVYFAANWGRATPRSDVSKLSKALPISTGEMILVPAGEFQSGEQKRRVSVPAFYIDRTEVTNEAYDAFCKATNRKPPENFQRLARELPVVNLTISDARDFATWAGKRLPRPLEWEKAARGEEGHAYPWGNERESSRANVCPLSQAECEAAARQGRLQLKPAGSYAAAESPYGALNMVGNVWEFVDQLTPPSSDALRLFKRLQPPPRADEAWYMIRGQSYAEPLVDSAIWDFMVVPGRWKDRFIGFRCVKDIY